MVYALEIAVMFVILLLVALYLVVLHRYCKTSWPSYNDVCTSCWDEGTITCFDCNGSGEGMADGAKCLTCKGNGEIPCVCQNKEDDPRC